MTEMTEMTALAALDISGVGAFLMAKPLDIIDIKGAK